MLSPADAHGGSPAKARMARLTYGTLSEIERTMIRYIRLLPWRRLGAVIGYAMQGFGMLCVLSMLLIIPFAGMRRQQVTLCLMAKCMVYEAVGFVGLGVLAIALIWIFSAAHGSNAAQGDSEHP